MGDVSANKLKNTLSALPRYIHLRARGSRDGSRNRDNSLRGRHRADVGAGAAGHGLRPQGGSGTGELEMTPSCASIDYGHVTH